MKKKNKKKGILVIYWTGLSGEEKIEDLNAMRPPNVRFIKDNPKRKK